MSLISVLVIVYIFVYYRYPLTQIKTEKDVLSMPVTDPLWINRLHAHSDGRWTQKPMKMKQSDRLTAMKSMASSVASALNKTGLPVFLTAGTLMGYLRHEDEWLPWEDDVNLAWDSATCMRLFPEGSLRDEVLKHLDENIFHVYDYLGCQGKPEGKRGRSLAGRIVDKRSGFYVDLYGFSAFSGIKGLEKFKVGNHVDREDDWLLESDLSHPRYYCPKSVLFPLKPASFEGAPVYIPNNPHVWVACQYGQDIDVPLKWQGFFLYVHTSILSLLIGLLAVWMTQNVGFAVALGSAFVIFDGGPRIVAMMAAACAMVVVVVRQHWKLPLHPNLLIIGLLIISLICDLWFTPRVWPRHFAIRWRPEDLPFIA